MKPGIDGDVDEYSRCRIAPVLFHLTWARPSGALTLRDWLAHLARTGRVATIDKPVALEHELAAIAKRLDGTQAAFFHEAGRS